MKKTLIKPIIVLSLFSCGLMPQIAIAAMNISKFVWGKDYIQTANNTQNTTADFFIFDSVITFNGIGDTTSVTINHTSYTAPKSYTDDSGGNGTFWFLENDFTSQSNLLAAFPDNTSYTIEISGGTLGTQTFNFDVAAESFATGADIPYLTGDTFNNLQGMDVNTDLDVTWNNPFAASATNVSVGAFDILTDDEIWTDGVSDPAAVTGANLLGTTILAGSLLADTEYGFFLEFSKGNVAETGTTLPSSTSQHVYGFNSNVGFNFTTASVVPVPAAVWLFGSGLIGLIAVARRKA